MVSLKPGLKKLPSPRHYVEGRKYEPLDVILDWKLSYCLGNVLKYIARYKRKASKNPKEDLLKALTYLIREIERE